MLNSIQIKEFCRMRKFSRNSYYQKTQGNIKFNMDDLVVLKQILTDVSYDTIIENLSSIIKRNKKIKEMKNC